MLAARYENDGYVYMVELLEKDTAYCYKGYGNFSDIKLIRENYTNLKNKLGHIPALAVSTWNHWASAEAFIREVSL